MRFYLEIVEGGERIPAGDRRGYTSFEEAIEAAKRHVDDALPRNTIRVYQERGYAMLGGDGDSYFHHWPT